jgi:hypothetical protein
MTPIQELTQALHANVLEAARRAGVAVDETYFASAFTQEASIGVAALSLSADELSDLRGGRNVMFVTLTLPPGIDKTVDGVPVTDGAYLLNVTLDETATKASARLMTTAGREIGVLPVEVKPDHHHPEKFAVSGHAGQCSAAGDISFTIGRYTVTVTVMISWC